MSLKFAVCLPSVKKPAALGGGYLNTMRVAELLKEHADVELVSYRLKEDGIWFLPDVESKLIAEQFILLLLWGADVTPHVDQYHGRLPILYYHYGIDFGVRLRPDIPILCNSRYLMSNAQEHWPANPQFYLPPILGHGCENTHEERDIDVTIVRRKLPPYVMDTLAPALQSKCRLHVLEDFIDRTALYRLFNRTRVYVYAFAPQRSNDSSTGWRMMEGFGIQPLEAAVCGCTVFTNLRGGMADYIDPSFQGYRLESHSPAWDAFQILRAVKTYPEPHQTAFEANLRDHYGEPAFHRRAGALIEFLKDYLPFAATHRPDAAAFGFPQPIGRWEKASEGIVSRLSRWKRQWLGPRPRHVEV